MVVRVEGIDARGAAVQRGWHSAADDNHGPETPCVGLPALQEFAPEFPRGGMVTDVVDDGTRAT